MDYPFLGTFVLCLNFLLFFGCEPNGIRVISSEQYEIHIPKNQQKLLILFPGFFGNAKQIQRESSLVKKCLQENIAVLLLNYNSKLFLTNPEKTKLAVRISKIIQENEVAKKEIYLGGFSSGGNIALLLAKELENFQNGKFSATGVFVIDPPVDLVHLYKSSKKTVAENHSELAVKEAKFIIAYLESKLGNPKDDFAKYERFSPFLGMTKGIENIQFESTAIKIYTEPAPIWNEKHRDRKVEDLNAFSLKRMAQTLEKNGVETDYYETRNQGYRSNGQRHPHAWSVLDEDAVVDWMMESSFK